MQLSLCIQEDGCCGCDCHCSSKCFFHIHPGSLPVPTWMEAWMHASDSDGMLQP